jgi:chitodextrinase
VLTVSAANQPPSVAFTSPVEGSTFTGTVTLYFTDTDDTGVASVTLSLDGVQLANWKPSFFEGGSIPTQLSYPIDTTKYANGPHTVAVTAVDRDGLSTTANRLLSFDNSGPRPPIVTFTSPAEGATVSGSTVVAFTNSADVGVASVTLSLDGTQLAAWNPGFFEGGGIPTQLSYSISTTSYVNGSHTVTVVAVDRDGRTTTVSLHLTFANSPLVASYAFEDGDTILRDGSGNGHYGVLGGGLGTSSWVTGKSGKALSFDGIDDTVSLNAMTTFYQDGFTLEAWVKKASARGDEGIVGAWTFDAGGGPVLWVDDGGNYRLAFGTDVPSYLDAGEAPVVGQWQHIAGTYDGTTARLYVDGVEKASADVPASDVGGSTLWKIGAYDTTGGYWDGLIDDVKIYRTARSAAEIQSDMGGAAPPADTTPPSAPGALTATSATTTSIATSWAASTDNVGVRLYDLYRGGVKIATTTSTSYTFTGLTCGAPYDLAVAAEDDAGNVSTKATLRASTAACPPPPGSVAGYSFEEGSGTSVGDNSGNGRGATLAGGAAWAAGKIGGGLTLDGVDGRVELPSFGNSFYKTAFTFEAWVKKASSSGDAAIVGTWTSDRNGGPMLWVDGDGQYVLTLNRGYSNYLFSGRSVTPGKWQHVAGTYDGTTARIYVDGALAASRSFSGNVGDSATWRIGAYGVTPAGAFDGTIDEVRLYSRALSATEIASEMAGPGSLQDLTPPSAPPRFRATGATATSISTAWDPSTDDTGIGRYRLYVDGVSAGFTSLMTFTYVVLPCGTTFTLAIEAVDLAGHASQRTSLSASTAACDTTSGLLARYLLDDGSGATAADATGGGHNGTLLGGAAWGTGRTGGAVALDGLGGRIDLPSLGTFYKTGFTLEAWIRKPSTVGDEAIVGTWTNDGNGGPMLWIDHLSHHLRLTLNRGVSNYLDAGVEVPTDGWHHVAGTYDGTYARLYLDGKVVAWTVYSGNPGDSSTWRIGSYGATATGFFNGAIDDVRIYNRGLAPDEIAATLNG